VPCSFPGHPATWLSMAKLWPWTARRGACAGQAGPPVSVKGSFSETPEARSPGPLPGVLRVSRIERYPDTAARRGAALPLAGHDVGKPCRENYAA